MIAEAQTRCKPANGFAAAERSSHARDRKGIGAGEGNRTPTASLEGWCSTIELHPRPARAWQGRRADAAHSPIQQLPWSQPTLTLEPSRILSDDQIETIHRQSLKVLPLSMTCGV